MEGSSRWWEAKLSGGRVVGGEDKWWGKNKWGRVVGGEVKWWEARGGKTKWWEARGGKPSGGRQGEAKLSKGDKWGGSGR